MYPLWKIYHKDIPEPILRCMELDGLKRLKEVGMNCGMEYTSFPFYGEMETYSRFEHSVSVSLIVYHFTKDLTQALAGLFHDISTPVFSHVIDFMNQDHIKQENTEALTDEFLRRDTQLVEILKEYNISIDEINDYHKYPIADNNAPRLSADRLEYTLGSLYHYHLCTIDEIKEYYENLTILTNEEGEVELGFKDELVAISFAKKALQCSYIYSTDEDRYGMETLARILKKALKEGIITQDDLYKTEPILIDKLVHSSMNKDWEWYCNLIRVDKIEQPIDESYIKIYTKKRYINPLTKSGLRCSTIAKDFAIELEKFLNQSFDSYLKGESRMKNKSIVVATTNEGKLKEFKEMLEPIGYTVLSLKDLDHSIEIDENGTTFRENAIIKAQSVVDEFGIEAISDDSGIEIDALNKEPGVHSARYLGHDTPYEIKNQKILDMLKDEKNRTCRYVCAIAWCSPNQEPKVFEDTVECELAYEAKGSNGFGYDPIVYYPPLQKTMAEMDKDEKNAISHRGKAIRKLEEYLDEIK